MGQTLEFTGEENTIYSICLSTHLEAKRKAATRKLVTNSKNHSIGPLSLKKNMLNPSDFPQIPEYSHAIKINNYGPVIGAAKNLKF